MIRRCKTMVVIMMIDMPYNSKVFNNNDDIDNRQKDMLELTSSKRIEVTADNKGGATLTIRKAKVTDAGLYLVQAQSRSGRVKSSATLRVRGK